MPIFRVSGKNILFIHIPKAGGTSVEAFLSQLSGESFRMHYNTEGFPCVPQHFHGALLDKLFDEDFFDYSFCVTRNPYARILSEYNYRMQHRKRPYRWFPAPKFDAWVRATLARYNRNPYIYSNHIRPQVEFRLQQTRAFRLEDQIADLMRELAELIGAEIPEVLPRENSSHKRVTRISDETAEHIYAFYKDDFEQFGYARESYSKL
jgi:hypothetical protein